LQHHTPDPHIESLFLGLRGDHRAAHRPYDEEGVDGENPGGDGVGDFEPLFLEEDVVLGYCYY